jgi:hypothetical protein
MQIANIDFSIIQCLPEEIISPQQLLAYDSYEVSIDWPKEITEEVVASWPEEIGDEFNTQYDGVQSNLITALWAVNNYLITHKITATIKVAVMCSKYSWSWFVHDVLHSYLDTINGETYANSAKETIRIAQQIIYAWFVGQPIPIEEVANYVVLCECFMRTNLLDEIANIKVNSEKYSFLNVQTNDIKEFVDSDYFELLLSEEMFKLLARIPTNKDKHDDSTCWLIPWEAHD